MTRYVGKISSAVILLGISLFATAPQSRATEDLLVDCSAIIRDVPVESKAATASTYANFRNSEESLRFQSKRMFEAGAKAVKQLAAPGDLCPAGCAAPAPASMVLQAVPKKFLRDYSDEAECTRFLAETKKQPFLYPDRAFANLEAFMDWYNDFSTGKGKDGEDLYRRCPGSCSPQYTTIVTESGGKLYATAKVICGPARDKSDNQYDLSFSYRWVCRSLALK